LQRRRIVDMRQNREVSQGVLALSRACEARGFFGYYYMLGMMYPEHFPEIQENIGALVVEIEDIFLILPQQQKQILLGGVRISREFFVEDISVLMERGQRSMLLIPLDRLCLEVASRYLRSQEIAPIFEDFEITQGH
jgi:hypothetical protein